MTHPTEQAVERAAKAIMMARGGCKVVDWREANWNPNVADALQAARAVLSADLGDMVLVPREPTKDMGDAGWSVAEKARNDFSTCTPAMIYRAMIAAARGEE